MHLRRVLGVIGRTMIAAGVIILLFVAYQLWGTGLAESRSQDALRKSFAEQVATAPPDPSAEPAPVPEGEAVAIIKIPKLDVEKAVVEGVSLSDLKKGPGHYPTSPLPGQKGNVAIAGHRTTYGAPFFRLDELAPGDLILITTRQGSFKYRVTEAKVVKPRQNEVLLDFGDSRLTLTTCHPRFSASERLIISSRLEGEALPGRTTTVPPEVKAVAEESLSGDPTARGPAFAWGAMCASFALLVWAAGKAVRRPWLAYAVGAVPFLVLLFVFFENFARLLPANV